MNFFFSETANGHHDIHHHGHRHDRAGFEVDTDGRNNSDSESTHDDEKRNHHQAKESKDMNRTIKNSSAPILTVFALSIMFVFCLAFDAKAFEIDALNFGKDFPIASRDAGNLDYNNNVTGYATFFDADGWNSDGWNVDGWNVDGWNVDFEDFSSFRSIDDFDAFPDVRADYFSYVDGTDFAYVGRSQFDWVDGKDFFDVYTASFNSFSNSQFNGIDTRDFDFIEAARGNFERFDAFDSDGFSSKGFPA